MEYDPLRRGVAEFVGTFTLIFAGAGSILTVTYMAGQVSGLPLAFGNLATLTAVALAHGLAIAVMVSAVGHVSGGHFNPAVTFGFLITRRIDPLLGAVYWATQLVAATAAALVLRAIYPGGIEATVHLGAPALAPDFDPWQGLVVEMVLTFFLVFVVFASAVDGRGTFKQIAGLAIGFTLTMGIFMGGPITGAAMNPARAFGPELAGHFWGNAWIYYVGPLVGGGLAALVYDLLYLRPAQPEPVGPPESGVEEPAPGEAAGA